MYNDVRVNIEDLEKEFENLMLELEKYGDAKYIECAESFKEEWNLCLRNVGKIRSLPSMTDHYNEMKSAFETFQTKWMSFQQNHFDLDEDVAFKGVSEKHALLNNKANQVIKDYDAFVKRCNLIVENMAL